MPLTPEQVKELYANKSKPKQATTTATTNGADTTKPKRPRKLIRRRIDYPDLPKDGPVSWHDTYPPYPKLHCASRGCRIDTPYTYRGIPYCVQHMIYYLAIEITDLTRAKANGSSNETDSAEANYDDRGKDYF